RVLYFYGAGLNDIDAVAGLSELTNLTVLGTAVSDISALEHLQNLNHVNLAYTQVSDLGPLARNEAFADDDPNLYPQVHLTITGLPLDLSLGSQARQDIETIKGRNVIV